MIWLALPHMGARTVFVNEALKRLDNAVGPDVNGCQREINDMFSKPVVNSAALMPLRVLLIIN
jgi:hypothetical protein